VGKGRTTLAEVAQAAGVSIATVSKVLNDRDDVAEHTRTRVLKHLRAAAYRPVGSDGAHLSPRRMIEVVFPEAQNSYSIDVLRGVTETAHLLDYDVVMGRKFDTNDRRHPDLDPHLLLRSGRAGAVFITMDISADHQQLMREADFPAVFVDPVHRGDDSRVSVGATNFIGGVMATEHLLELGHRRIGHAAGLADVDCSQARLAGYASALRTAGIALDESLVTHCPYYYADGRKAAAQLLDRDEPPTAIFAGNDEIALGVMEEARRRSIRVPEDLSVVGFDDSFLATRSTPQLTTVAQPLVELGAVAVRTLTRMINHEPVDSHHTELATRLVIRDSTAPAD
jgi:LacI family transcriptional regulator